MGQSPQVSNLFISIILALNLFSRANNPHWFQSKYKVPFFLDQQDTDCISCYLKLFEGKLC